MTVDEVIAELISEKEKRVSSRFSCRAIMVNTISEYAQLISELKKIPDAEIVTSDKLFSSADVMPRYESLTAPAYKDSWLILPGVSEYLRLFSANEAETQRFAKLWRYKNQATSLGRILIPLWGCEAQWHDRTLHLCEDERQELFYYDCTEDSEEEQKLQVLALSGEFEQALQKMESQGGQVLVGLREWYESWCDVQGADNIRQILLTKRYASIQPTSGDISIRVIRDKLAFLKENLRDARILTEENCPQEAQALLFDYALQGEGLDKAILSVLNVAEFANADVMSKWGTMGTGERQLAFLWLKLHPDKSYLYHCVQAVSCVEQLPNRILRDIFPLCGAHPDWIAESRVLLSVMGIARDEAYYSELECIPVYEDRLPFLTGKERDERIYLLRLIGKWLRQNPKQVYASKKIRGIYPSLFAYLDKGAYDSDLARYFSLYKSHKLENTLPEDEKLYFSDFRTDEYDYRYAKLSSAITGDCMILWIDALGAEWLPLLLWALSQSEKGTVKEYSVVQAVLPTETVFNEQWKQMDVPYRKLDRLDKLAHKGVIDEPDYYACIEEQLSFIAGIRSAAEDMLKNSDRVIITGDHGTSRLAARMFHRREGVTVPAGAKACSHGRYCILSDSVSTANPNLLTVKDSDGNCYAVFSNYDHFTQSGFAAGADDENAIYGEIHGGASPEETLVPLIVFDSAAPRPLAASWDKNTVKIQSKRAKAVLKFNRPVHALQVKVGATEGVCRSMENGKVWEVVFKGIAPAVHNVSVAADGALVQAEPLEILPALGGGEGDLP
ncbi:MAG: BREX-4 system phosphatase PglZ [Oscillospiraceae bacterium]|nr:BREX-4 system phosphatase PglZ [Oscillospiraceae bacterium]